MLPEEDTVLSWWGESSKETISAPWSVRALAVSRKFSLWLSICGEIGGEGQTSDQPWPGFFWFLRTNDSPALRNLLISCVMIRPQLFAQKCVHMRYCLHACNRNKDVYSFHVHNISLNVKGNRSATSEPPPVDGCRAVAGGFWLCEWPLVRLASQHRPQILKTHNQHYPRHVWESEMKQLVGTYKSPQSLWEGSSGWVWWVLKGQSEVTEGGWQRGRGPRGCLRCSPLRLSPSPSTEEPQQGNKKACNKNTRDGFNRNEK